MRPVCCFSSPISTLLCQEETVMHIPFAEQEVKRGGSSFAFKVATVCVFGLVLGALLAFA